MARFRLHIEYDGRPFHGWQRQETGPTVQAAIEEALLPLTDGKYVHVQCSGRTDAGVHAIGQVAHLDLDRDISPTELQGALNYYLRLDPVSILGVDQVSDDFHARFSATARHYEYHIINRRAPLTFETGLAWHVATPLDADAMDEAAQSLVGTHDFTTFRHIRCQAKSPVKTLDYLAVERDGERIIITTGARSFLHHQVRSMVGCLKLVGEGNWTKDDLKGALESADRTRLGLNAPPDGLYLTAVEFGDQ